MLPKKQRNKWNQFLLVDCKSWSLTDDMRRQRTGSPVGRRLLWWRPWRVLVALLIQFQVLNQFWPYFKLRQYFYNLGLWNILPLYWHRCVYSYKPSPSNKLCRSFRHCTGEAMTVTTLFRTSSTPSNMTKMAGRASIKVTSGLKRRSDGRRVIRQRVIMMILEIPYWKQPPFGIH